VGHVKEMSGPQAAERLIELVSQGSGVFDAVAAVDRSRTWYHHLRRDDPGFRERVEAARAGSRDRVRRVREVRGDDSVANLSFVEWRKRFLGRETFPHMQNWVDVLEDREPSWWHESMVWVPSRRNRLIFNVPPFHAKSQTLTVDYVTYKLCMNPNFRVILVSKKQDQAKKFLHQIRQRLTSNLFAPLQEAYGGPTGFKAAGAKWAGNMIYVGGRDSDAADPSIEAIGMGGQIYGSRADLILLDDCVTLGNANEYEKQITWIESEVESRCFDGKILVVGTRLAPVDLYSELRSGDRYLSGKSPWSYFSMPMVLEFAEDPADWVTLWPRSDKAMDENDQNADEDGTFQAWDGKRCAALRDAKPPRTWALVYQQSRVSEDAIFHPDAVWATVDKRRKVGPLVGGAWGHPPTGMDGMHVVGSIDPAGTGAAFVLVMAVDRQTGHRWVLNCWCGTHTTPSWYADLMGRVTPEFRVQEWVIEQNAYASWIIHDERIVSYCRQRGVRIASHYTGRNKQDPDFGVASMSSLFGTFRRHTDGGRPVHNGNHLIHLPDPGQSEGVKALIEQLITWQPGIRGRDLVQDGTMALWFAELRARAATNSQGRSGKRQNFVENSYLSRGDKRRRLVVPSVLAGMR
jgi:hypothetical protein